MTSTKIGSPPSSTGANSAWAGSSWKSGAASARSGGRTAPSTDPDHPGRDQARHQRRATAMVGRHEGDAEAEGDGLGGFASRSLRVTSKAVIFQPSRSFRKN